jgi:hypothetical protein
VRKWAQFGAEIIGPDHRPFTAVALWIKLQDRLLCLIISLAQFQKGKSARYKRQKCDTTLDTLMNKALLLELPL